MKLKQKSFNKKGEESHYGWLLATVIILALAAVFFFGIYPSMKHGINDTIKLSKCEGGLKGKCKTVCDSDESPPGAGQKGDLGCDSSTYCCVPNQF